jgi:formate dehydrogenase subunit beta
MTRTLAPAEMHSALKELLDSGEIDALLAWSRTAGHPDDSDSVGPALFRKGDALDLVVFDERCVHNLTAFLHSVIGRFAKVGILLKGCDGRSLSMLMAENRIPKDKVMAITATCEGVRINGEKASKCADCATALSPVADIVIGQSAPKEAPGYAGLEKIEGMSPAERWAYFAPLFASCTRCYACRQVCALCYCETCVADQEAPKWIEPSVKLSANTMWHFARAIHLAGRCADCGECERVCPQHIPLRTLNIAMEKAVVGMFDTRPGTVAGVPGPLITLSENDPDAILGGTL